MEVKKVREGQKGPQDARSQERLHTLKVQRVGEKSWIPGAIRMCSRKKKHERSGKAPFDSMKGQTSIEVRRIQRSCTRKVGK